MPEYLSPGVYVEEIDAGPRPIAGVGTSTAGFVGVTDRGPVFGKPRLVTNFLEFQRTFGGFLPEPPTAGAWGADAAEGGHWWTFPLSVKGFFDNGGQRLYVKRVAAGGARSAAGTLVHGLTSEVTRDAAKDATELTVRHLLGFSGVGQAVEVIRGDNGQAVTDPTTIAGYSSAGLRLTLAAPLREGVKASRGDYVRVITPEPPSEAVTFRAVSPGGWGNGVQVRMRPAAGATLPLLADAGEGAGFVTALTEMAPADSPTVKVGEIGGLTGTLWVLINGVRRKVTASPAEEGVVTLSLEGQTSHPEWRSGTTVQRVRRAVVGNRGSLGISGGGRLYRGALIQLDSGEAITVRKVTDVRADVVTFEEPLPGDAEFFENERLVLIEAEVAVRSADAVEEVFGNVRPTVDDPADPVGLIGRVRQSNLVRVSALNGPVQTPTTGGVLFPTVPLDPAEPPAAGGWLPLTDGDDAYDSLGVGDFIGEDGGSGARTGIVALEDIDEVAICAVPGVWAGSVQSALITHCEFLKDRFAILDPQLNLSIEGIQEFREPFDTSYAALYHPWLSTRDPVSGRDVEVAPSGHIAGIYARVDVERGVHKAPANAIIRGIRLQDGLAQDITRRHQDLLNPRGINALRFFPGQGHRVWGARTLSADPAWRYINVRRLFLFIEESIDEGTQWVVFEPNAEPLWALVKQTVENFLGTVWRSGALAGTTADEAFFVACDRTTMTEDDLLNGRLVCVVGVAPVHPAEFVIFRIQQKTRESQLT